jgi:hypothetical protein
MLQELEHEGWEITLLVLPRTKLGGEKQGQSYHHEGKAKEKLRWKVSTFAIAKRSSQWQKEEDMYTTRKTIIMVWMMNMCC